MKKLLLSIAITTAITSLTACHLEDHHGTGEHSHNHDHEHDKSKSDDTHIEDNETTDTNSEAADSLKIQTIKKPISESGLNFTNFDWTNIAQSNAKDVTSIQLPEGMKLVGIPLESPNQVSSFAEEVTLNMYNADKAHSETGDLAYFDVAMAEEGESFDKALFDTDNAKYMESLGAVKIFDGVVPAEVITELKAVKGTTSYEYMTGETEAAHLRQYVLNHKNGTQSFYQIVSDNTHGQMGILEISSAQETPAPNTATTDKAATDKAATDKAATDKAATDKAAADKAAADKAAADKAAADKAVADKAVADKAVADKAVADKAVADKAVADKAAADKAAADKAAAPSAKTSADMKSQLDAGGKAILNINFDPATSTIKSKNRKIVDEIYTLLIDNPEMKVSIEGHTDDVGNADYNLQLSTKRAESVKNTLVKRGIDSNRLRTAGFGKVKPMIPNTTMNNRAANRRVELVEFK